MTCSRSGPIRLTVCSNGGPIDSTIRLRSRRRVDSPLLQPLDSTACSRKTTFLGTSIERVRPDSTQGTVEPGIRDVFGPSTIQVGSLVIEMTSARGSVVRARAFHSVNSRTVASDNGTRPPTTLVHRLLDGEVPVLEIHALPPQREHSPRRKPRTSCCDSGQRLGATRHFIATPCGLAGPVANATLKSTSKRGSRARRFLNTLTTCT